jgi:glutamine amidotransferase
LIAILDYGSGNLRSALRAFQTTGLKVEVTNDAQVAKSAQALVIPGVGAFSACVSSLLRIEANEIIQYRVDKQLPIFGICVGMQILFSDSQEGDAKDKKLGLGIWPNKVVKLSNPILPHMGWNTVNAPEGSILFNGLNQAQFYFVHSYAVVERAGQIASFTDYDQKFLAAIEDGSIVATQFHPEKSGQAGLKLINNWAKSI